MKQICTEVSCEFFQSYEWCKAPSCPYKKSVTMTSDGYWYHGNGKLGGEFHPTKPNDEERYGEYVKVKHGRWIKRGDNSWECSVCHEISCCNGNYCVDCGARMDTPNNAHWIKQLNGEYKCSVCGDTTLAPLYECGTCGTKMGGVENERI